MLPRHSRGMLCYIPVIIPASTLSLACQITITSTKLEICDLGSSCWHVPPLLRTELHNGILVGWAGRIPLLSAADKSPKPPVLPRLTYGARNMGFYSDIR